MALKSHFVAAKNRFPGAIVIHHESGVDVHSRDGELLAACRKDGHGRIVDAKDELGAKYAWSTSPIPRNCRVHKIAGEGKVILDEKASERKPVAQKLFERFGYVPSLQELADKGYKLCDNWKSRDKAHQAEVILEEEPKAA